MTSPPHRRARLLLAFVVTALLLLPACSDDDPAATPTTPVGPTSPTTPTTDSAAVAGWWCHPALPDDPCRQADLRTTSVDWELVTMVEDAPAAVDPAADCFALPPASADDAEAQEWIRIDLARFRTVCALYVPKASDARGIRAAFDELTGASERPFVVLGHREGADEAMRLLQEAVDPDASLRARLVSGLLVGGTAAVQVPDDAPVGGTFANLPVCTGRSQSGCVVAFHMFEDGFNPGVGEGPFVGLAADRRAACTHAGEIEGSKGQLRAATLPVDSTLSPPPVLRDVPAVDTPFITLREYYVAECLPWGSGVWYLWLGRSIDPDDQRFPASLTLGDEAAQRTGLTLVDLALTQGDLLALVQEQLDQR